MSKKPYFRSMFTPHKNSLTNKDAKIIADTVEAYGNDYDKVLTFLLGFFGKDITVDHYVCIGQVIGIKSAMTEFKQRTKNKFLDYGKN